MNTSIYSQLILLNKNDTDHYLRRYIKMVSFYKQRNFKKKKFIHHEHHILPKSFGGLDTKENLVYITIREHFILHHLLYKAFPKSSMTTAFFAMCTCWGQKVSSKVYEKLKIENAKRHSETQKKLVLEGKHHLLDKEKASQRNKKRVAEGKHNWQDKEKARERANKRVADGNHNFQDKEKARERANKRVADGEHNFSGDTLSRKRLENGTHPSQIKKMCPHCNQEFNIANFSVWHGDKCKLNPLFVDERKPKPKIECPHCHKEFSSNTFARWHGDKCKLKPHDLITS